MENIKNSLQNIKEEKINLVRNSLASLFTKDDVRAIIQNIYNDALAVIDAERSEVVNNGSLNHSKIIQVLEDVMDNVGRSVDNDLVQLNNLSFSIDYSNEVRLDEYDVELSDYNRELLCHFKEALLQETESEVSAQTKTQNQKS